MSRHALAGAAAGWWLVAGVVANAAVPTGELPFHDARPAMGTTFEVFVYASDAQRAALLFEAAFDEIERVESSLSNYRSTAELSRINSGAAQRAIVTDPELFALLDRSLDYSRRTQGAFDVTVGRLIKAWGFYRGRGSYPTESSLAEALAASGWQHLRLDPASRGVRFATPGLEIDLGAIGKGYALDQVARLLASHGVTRALIGAGDSSYYALGAPPGEPGWLIRIPDPFDRSRVLSTVRIKDAALSTSGSYEKFFELDGRRYCHIVDPRSGRPVVGMLQATVLAPTAADSDALSTAIFVMGTEQGRGLVDTQPSTAALLVAGDARAATIRALNWPSEVVPSIGPGSQHSPLLRPAGVKDQ